MAEATVSKKKKIRRSDYQYTVFKAMRNEIGRAHV